MGDRLPSPDWMSYDSVADTYERVAVPRFRAVAQDLVDALAPAPGDRVLDVGTGTGLVADLALTRIQPGGYVIGIDPSTGMLARTRRRQALVLAAAMVPGLPVPDASVDLVVGNLVLSHLPHLADGMAELVRVLRQGGRFGATAWAAEVPGSPGNDRPEADAVVAQIKKRRGLDLPSPRGGPVPHEEWLRDQGHLLGLLAEAGLGAIGARCNRYEWTFSVEEFLCGWGSQGRYLRAVAGEDRWKLYVEEAAAALHERFGDSIKWVSDAWVIVGHKE